MLRTCPKCGDFFAGDAPPFCPADGTPLADVDPRDLNEGARVVEEKSRILHRSARRLKLRRIFTTVMTLIVTTLVVYVVVGNYVVYLKPDPEAPALLAAVTPSPSPPPPTPVPVPTPSDTPTPSPTPTPTPTCTDAERHAAEKLIVEKNRDGWGKVLEGERLAVIEQYVPAVLTPRGEREERGGAATPSYRVTLSKDCQTAAVTYSWHVTWEANVNGTRSNEAKTVKGKRTFRCLKKGAAWPCP
ncbi:MAG: hypothetical protein JOZ02_23090 [Acidobacteria bacterium]|nr:hypothetical protein [Acidobacteriota bacterium]